MSRQVITGGDGSTGQSGEVVKDILNENFIELYDDKGDAKITTRSVTGNHTLDSTDLTAINSGQAYIISGDDTGSFEIPLNATVATENGTVFGIEGFDEVTVSDVAITVTDTRGDSAIPSGQTAYLRQINTNNWILYNGTVGSSVTASSTTFSPAGTISSTNVQDAIEEVAAEAASASVSDASETVKGIVEEATAAQLAAGTATGETSAKLFITPAKFLGYMSLVSASVSPSGGNLTLVITKVLQAFYGDISSDVSLVLNVTSPYKQWKIVLRVTGTRVVTLPSDCYMPDYESNLGRWNPGTKGLTLIGTTTTSFELTGWYENSIWLVQCSGAYV